jgi:hypothetical protein
MRRKGEKQIAACGRSGLWKSRSVGKSKGRAFPPRLEIRKTCGFPLFHSHDGDGWFFIGETGELKTQIRPRPKLTYCSRKMVLTLGSTTLFTYVALDCVFFLSISPKISIGSNTLGAHYPTPTASSTTLTPLCFQ